MKTWLLALLLATNISYAAELTNVDRATQLLAQADKLLNSNQLREAAMKDMEVLKMKGLPDNIYSSAYLLMGNIGLTSGRLEVADSAYRNILKLKDAPESDKRSARSGILLVGDLRRDAENPEPPVTVYK